jgi:subtilisin family serine protease
MMRQAAACVALLFVFVLIALPSPQSGEAGPATTVTVNKVWVYFIDRGHKTPAGLQLAIANAPVSERSLERRRLRSGGPLTDIHDVPVSGSYLRALRDAGCVLKRPSKYLNAVSVLATGAQIEAIRRLPFVKKVVPVRTYRRRPAPVVEGAEPAPHRPRGGPGPAEDYGPSFDQLDQINVPQLHDSGITGAGVVVAIFDTGFNRSHEALDHLDVIAEWDFVFNDSITKNEPEDVYNQHYHGTYTLSALGGYAPGSLIGPAWEASFVLAKTERMFEEVQGEEDDYVRALEWADSIGASIVSSSLGYFDWYTWDDMDGNTAVTTVAADIAASKGITVVTAAGNEGCCGDPLSWPGIIAPSDGDSVIAVGAVDASGVVANFSSRGPARDGRIKPDVMARGVATYCASPWDSLGYLQINGTSLSTPLVAGACALLEQMHPHWGPIDVRTALRNEASNSATPDTVYGWGIIDAYHSSLNGATGIMDAVSIDLELTGGVVRGTVLNTGHADLVVDIAREQQDLETGGSILRKVVKSNVVIPGSASSTFVDKVGVGGVFRYRVQLSGDPSQRSGWSDWVVVAFPFALRQSAPNPFVAGRDAEAAIVYTIDGLPAGPGPADVAGFHEVRLEIYDVRGARVRTLVDGIQTPDEHRETWDGRDDTGDLVASGVYFYRLSVDGRSLTRKLVLIRR